MNFEKKMQKRGNKTLDTYTPDLYPNNHSFPLWAKISIPVGGALVASAIVVAVVLTNLSPFASKNNMFVAAPKRMAVVSLNQSLVNRTASKH